MPNVCEVSDAPCIPNGFPESPWVAQSHFLSLAGNLAPSEQDSWNTAGAQPLTDKKATTILCAILQIDATHDVSELNMQCAGVTREWFEHFNVNE